MTDSSKDRSSRMTFTASERLVALIALVLAFRDGDELDESIAYGLGVVTILRGKAKQMPLLRSLLGEADDNDCEEGWSMQWLRSNSGPSFKICALCKNAIRTEMGFSPCADDDQCRFVPSRFVDRRPGHGPKGES